jgi:uncharacterized protein
MDDAQPWYAKGLRFQCTQCGDCCSGAPGYVWVVNEEIAALAAELKMEVADFEAKYVRKVGVRKSLIEYSNGDCVFLKDRKCTVYNARPRQCRTWPFWDSNLRSPEAWEQTCEVCPGAGKGQIVQIGEIERQRAVVKV